MKISRFKLVLNLAEEVGAATAKCRRHCEDKGERCGPGPVSAPIAETSSYMKEKSRITGGSVRQQKLNDHSV